MKGTKENKEKGRQTQSAQRRGSLGGLVADLHGRGHHRKGVVKRRTRGKVKRVGRKK